ncbi:hypothetical protein R1T16_16725 [Flavobacterium sp. DG1-102-2]|uniref:hypothetical protein n=1 Tax=Flavobacterium sp. DG1-102-2 TaxID=3081663 RepID=UPI00294971FE|nr:hypothetical protein [Flavobacterium sp. DG1-102-2]MDV6170085.1 hypothetical protein [Flavobacterium sp. DG1-102-2]
MKINLKSGVGELLFGMKEKDVRGVYGNPDRQFKDEDGNIIYLYNDKKLRLTFYQDEDMRLGYIIVSNPSSEIFGSKVIRENWTAIEAAAKTNGLKDFEVESFDTIDNHFNEANWIIFQVEFNEVIKIEIGATINKNDEFDWKFKA